jgi:hypothetical protein
VSQIHNDRGKAFPDVNAANIKNTVLGMKAPGNQLIGLINMGNLR